jgi:periplasmic protein TonB
MSQHVDTLDQREPLGKSFAGSVLFHILLVGSVTGVAIVRHNDGIMLGDKSPKPGTVSITPVSTIPLPSTDAPPNPVANDTKSNVPTPKEPPKPSKPKPEVKPPDPKAIPLKDSYTKTYTKPEYARADKFREQQKDQTNQLYSRAGAQMSSQMFAIQGSGTMGLGENAPFGNQFGAYAQILRNLVASKWRTTDIDARIRTAPQVTVTFTLHRDGSISGLRISQSSGIPPLDRSAQRAILDASPFPKMPPQFPKDQTDIDFVFELKR